MGVGVAVCPNFGFVTGTSDEAPALPVSGQKIINHDTVSSHLERAKVNFDITLRRQRTSFVLVPL